MSTTLTQPLTSSQVTKHMRTLQASFGTRSPYGMFEVYDVDSDALPVKIMYGEEPSETYNSLAEVLETRFPHIFDEEAALARAIADYYFDLGK